MRFTIRNSQQKKLTNKTITMELLKANVDLGRCGSLQSIEILSSKEKEFIQYAMNNELELHLGEVNGKHSDVSIGLEKDEPDFTFIELNDHEEKFTTDKLKITQFGDVCFSECAKIAVFEDFGNKNNVECSQTFGEWCQGQGECISDINDLNKSLLLSFDDYYNNED